MKKQVCQASAWAYAPFAIVAYAFLSLCDFGFTLAAFVMGAGEANPLLAWFYRHGLFEFAKLSSTLLVCCVAVRMWRELAVRRLMYIADGLMLLVLAYHIMLWLRFMWVD